MDISGAMLWWEEWQLRILVLTSLFIQWLLLLSASLRKLAIPSWLRLIIWLSYLGSDTLAIYALAILFGRERRQDCSSGQRNSILEVVWAPVLLVHLGGQDLITAYNIEDNELWTRHVLTAVSQVTVAIYVFCISWPGGNNRLLQASILFFAHGILKCIEKPLSLKSASINSLVSSSIPALWRKTDGEGGVNSLEDFVQKTRAFVQTNPHCQAQEGDGVDLETENHLPPAQENGALDLEADHQPRAQGEAAAVDLESDHHPQASSTWRSCLNQIKGNMRSFLNQERGKISRVHDSNVSLEAYKLFLDLASPYPNRLGILKSFWRLEEIQAYAMLQNKLFGTFDLLYTKRKMLSLWEEKQRKRSMLGYFSGFIRALTGWLPVVAIGLFHNSHREAYNAHDVKVTYAMFYCTAMLELISTFFITNIGFSTSDEWKGILLSDEQANKKVRHWKWVVKLVALYKQSEWHQASAARQLQREVEDHRERVKQMDAMKDYPDNLLADLTTLLNRVLSNQIPLKSYVGQYTLVGLFARNKRHNRKMCIANFFNCKEFIDQHWSMKPCNSSLVITVLVLKYVKKGWEDEMKDANSYRNFNDRRGQWTLQAHKCEQDLGCSLRRPFDESVLLWHIATDFCFYYIGALADHQCATALCGYAPGEGHAVWCKRSPHHRRAIRCRKISNYMIYLLFVNPEMLLPGTRRNLLMTANTELEEILKDDNPLLKKILNGDKPSFMEILKCNKPFLKFFTGKKPLLKEIDKGFMQRIITKVQPTENKEVVDHMDSPADVETDATTQEGFIHDAWKIAKPLLDLGDENKMWEVIEGVWVEMLCFSASRCRGYLHAKSLGTGGELLTYIWLLLSHMGMETLPERLQRTELSSGEGNSSTTPSTSQTSRSEDPQPHEAAAAAAHPSTSRPPEIVPAE